PVVVGRPPLGADPYGLAAGVGVAQVRHVVVGHGVVEHLVAGGEGSQGDAAERAVAAQDVGLHPVVAGAVDHDAVTEVAVGRPDVVLHGESLDHVGGAPFHGDAGVEVQHGAIAYRRPGHPA